MKSIKTNPNSVMGPDSGNCKQIVLHIIDNIVMIMFFLEKTDMKFNILVSNLKEISSSVFS